MTRTVVKPDFYPHASPRTSPYRKQTCTRSRPKPTHQHASPPTREPSLPILLPLLPAPPHSRLSHPQRLRQSPRHTHIRSSRTANRRVRPTAPTRTPTRRIPAISRRRRRRRLPADRPLSRRGGRRRFRPRTRSTIRDAVCGGGDGGCGGGGDGCGGGVLGWLGWGGGYGAWGWRWSYGFGGCVRLEVCGGNPAGLRAVQATGEPPSCLGG